MKLKLKMEHEGEEKRWVHVRDRQKVSGCRGLGCGEDGEGAGQKNAPQDVRGLHCETCARVISRGKGRLRLLVSRP